MPYGPVGSEPEAGRKALVHELIASGCVLHRILLASERRARELKEKAQNEISGKEAAEDSLCSQED